ncbi:dispatched homolog 1 isoform X1, partial [Paramuricea clavata]
VTVGSLVLMGWKLNILESITLSVSVGLSVDFALHHGVACVLAVDKTDRKSRVSFSLADMSSAITMAAFTTFITVSWFHISFERHNNTVSLAAESKGLRLEKGFYKVVEDR